MLKPTCVELQQGASPIAGEAEGDLWAVCERTKDAQLLHVPAPYPHAAGVVEALGVLKETGGLCSCVQIATRLRFYARTCIGQRLAKYKSLQPDESSQMTWHWPEVLGPRTGRINKICQRLCSQFAASPPIVRRRASQDAAASRKFDELFDEGAAWERGCDMSEVQQGSQ